MLYSLTKETLKGEKIEAKRLVLFGRSYINQKLQLRTLSILFDRGQATSKLSKSTSLAQITKDKSSTMEKIEQKPH